MRRPLEVESHHPESAVIHSNLQVPESRPHVGLATQILNRLRQRQARHVGFDSNLHPGITQSFENFAEHRMLVTAIVRVVQQGASKTVQLEAMRDALQRVSDLV